MIAKEIFWDFQSDNNATIKHEIVYWAHFSISTVQIRVEFCGFYGILVQNATRLINVL